MNFCWLVSVSLLVIFFKFLIVFLRYICYIILYIFDLSAKYHWGFCDNELHEIMSFDVGMLTWYDMWIRCDGMYNVRMCTMWNESVCINKHQSKGKTQKSQNTQQASVSYLRSTRQPCYLQHSWLTYMGLRYKIIHCSNSLAKTETKSNTVIFFSGYGFPDVTYKRRLG